MEIRPIHPAEFEQARRPLEANHWGPRVADPTAFGPLLERSSLALVAVEQACVVGFLRALTDSLCNGHISMVVVDERFRRRGIGRALKWRRVGSP
jgi:ribosomal protein S18 acetylase RimI-like enzyme